MIQVVVPISASDSVHLAALAQQAGSSGADLVEVRLDTCVSLGGDAASLVKCLGQLPIPVILTIRHASEQGHWRPEDAERAALYRAAVQSGVAYIDVELAQWPALQVAGLSLGGSATKLILSYHDFEGPGDDLDEKIRDMRAQGAAVAKIAIQARDASDLAIIADLYRDHGKAGPLVAIAMGEHGFASRLLCGIWGGHFTYARLHGEAGSAPGQPTVQDLLNLYRIKQQTEHTRIYAVIGSPVAHSLSPLIHNAAFVHHHVNAVYVPVRVEDAAAFWRACGPMFSGLSITIPHKPALLAHMHGVEALAARIGAMNTMYRDRELHAIGANTDALAVIRCLEGEAGCLKGRRVLLLGAGGVSRAVAFAATDRGAQVCITNRTFDRASELATQVGGRAVAWEEAPAVEYDILVNGTAVGMNQPDDSPWPATAHRKDSVVFDTVYQPLETRLLKDAQIAGARTVCGLDMLVSQALGQFNRWTGLEAPAAQMYRAALVKLDSTQTE